MVKTRRKPISSEKTIITHIWLEVQKKTYLVETIDVDKKI